MAEKLPLQSELKTERCAAFRKQTDGSNMLELAREAVAKYQRQENALNMSQRYSSYRGIAKPIFPKLDVCVEIEEMLQLAKGQVYRAITRTEVDLHAELQDRFGELPLRFDEKNKLYYNSDKNPENDTEVTEGMTLSQFDYILNRRNINSSALADAIGHGVQWQRIASLRRKASRGGEDEALPDDIAHDIVKGLQKLSDAPPAPADAPDDVKPKGRAPKKESKEGAQVEGLHITGFGGIDIALPMRLNIDNFPDCRIEDAEGNLLVQDNALVIPPIPLTQEQQLAIRKLVAEAISGTIRIG